MKSAIYYLSPHHRNTHQVAEIIGETLEAELFDLKNDSLEKPKEFELLGFGSGIYYRKHHRDLLNFVDELPEMPDKKVFVFSTSGFRKVPLLNPLHRHLKEILKEKKVELLDEFTCRGYDTYGPLKWIGGMRKGHPDEKDLERARQFARKINKQSG